MLNLLSIKYHINKSLSFRVSTIFHKLYSNLSSSRLNTFKRCKLSRYLTKVNWQMVNIIRAKVSRYRNRQILWWVPTLSLWMARSNSTDISKTCISTIRWLMESIIVALECHQPWCRRSRAARWISSTSSSHSQLVKYSNNTTRIEVSGIYLSN